MASAGGVSGSVVRSPGAATSTPSANGGKGATTDSGGASSWHASDLAASDTSILSQFPTALIRLLVLLGPLVTASAHLVRLATWTGGPGTASHSFLLVLGWWALCLYGYQTLRYAPQALLLSVIAFNGLKRAFYGTTSPSPAAKRVVSSDTVNATLSDLTTLADFASTLSAVVLAPALSLLNWQSPAQTRTVAVLLITTWPIWLLCFGTDLWDVVGLPRIGLGLGSWLRLGFQRLVALAAPHTERLSHSLWASVQEKSPALVARIDQARTLYVAHIAPVQARFWSWLAPAFTSPTTSAPTTAGLTIVPPFPLFSLSVRHLLLVVGTLALTWCSPWLALIRHALWRSAMVRRSIRSTIALLSGTSTGYEGHFTHLGPDADRDPFHSAAAAQSNSTEKSTGSGAAKKDEKAAQNITRHEDVIYQFTVFENQRWWVGLDWTAALLPQERPSWSDESNNPVLPPSSFSLPPARMTLKPTPTSSNPKSHVRRLVKWQWIDPEWSVAGRDGIPVLAAGRSNGTDPSLSPPGSPTPSSKSGGSRRLSSLSGTLFSQSSASTSFSLSNVEDDSSSTTTEVAPSSSSDPKLLDNHRRQSSSAASDVLPADLTLLDVDAEGWQYGDNGWEKMSRKAGMGRYTRRRRWIRRAVLVEIVERDYVPEAGEAENVHGSSNQQASEKQQPSHDPPALVNGTTSASAAPSLSTGTASASGSSLTLPSPGSPRSADLKQRLARAAQGSTSPS